MNNNFGLLYQILRQLYSYIFESNSTGIVLNYESFVEEQKQIANDGEVNSILECKLYICFNLNEHFK